MAWGKVVVKWGSERRGRGVLDVHMHRARRVEQGRLPRKTKHEYMYGCRHLVDSSAPSTTGEGGVLGYL